MRSGDIISLLQRLFPGQAIKLKLIGLYVALYGLLLGYLKCYLSSLPPTHKTRSLDVWTRLSMLQAFPRLALPKNWMLKIFCLPV